MEINDIFPLREQVWDNHPIIIERAILPTPALKDVLARVWSVSKKGRASIAYFARPLTGKSSCAEALVLEMKRKKPGCGVLIFEIVEDTNQAEGRLLSEILNQIDYAPKISRDLAGKRTQVHRALLALSGEARHLFLIFDEAQELSGAEFAWLKSVINRLVRDRVKVTVILFGQIELKEVRSKLKEKRSDLEMRFMATLHELNPLQGVKELEEVLLVVDEKSEYPAGSSLTYTQLLLPRFYAAGHRLHPKSAAIWNQLKKLKLTGPENRVSMSVVAAFLSSLFTHLKNLDSADLAITPELLLQVPMG